MGGVPGDSPLNVTFTSIGPNFLVISWKAPDQRFWNGKLTGYQICYSTIESDRNPKCSWTTGFSYTISNLKPFTKYYVAVSACTQVGCGRRSSEISRITDGGPSGPPLDIILKSRGKTSLEVSWKAPEKWNSELTGYQICLRTKNTTPECLVVKSTKVSTLTIHKLQPSSKYFVTVSANTKAGYGEKSLEVSKITNGEPVNPLPVSFYTLVLNIPRPAEYIKRVMVIVQRTRSSPTSSDNIKTENIKSYQSDIEGVYVTAYLKPSNLPVAFLIGDNREYNSGTDKYFNQPLKSNSSYITFLRFFENKDSYYSTEWSNSVQTMGKLAEECFSGQSSKQTTEKEIRLDFVIPLSVACLCLLVFLGVIMYQCRHRKNSNKYMSYRPQPATPANEIQDLGSNSTKRVQDSQKGCYTSDDVVYETPDEVLELIKRNSSEFRHIRGYRHSSDSKPEVLLIKDPQVRVALNNEGKSQTFYETLQLPSTSAGLQHKAINGNSGNSGNSPLLAASRIT